MNRVINQFIAAILGVTLLSACDQESKEKSDSKTNSAPSLSTSADAVRAHDNDFAAILTDDLKSDMESLGDGGSTTNDDLASYLGAISINSDGIPDGDAPNWTNPINILSAENGVSRITADLTPHPTVILHVVLQTNIRKHVFAYIGHFTETGVIFRREIIDLDRGDERLAAWKASWKFEAR